MHPCVLGIIAIMIINLLKNWFHTCRTTGYSDTGWKSTALYLLVQHEWCVTKPVCPVSWPDGLLVNYSRLSEWAPVQSKGTPLLALRSNSYRCPVTAHPATVPTLDTVASISLALLCRALGWMALTVTEHSTCYKRLKMKMCATVSCPDMYYLEDRDTYKGKVCVIMFIGESNTVL